MAGLVAGLVLAATAPAAQAELRLEFWSTGSGARAVWKAQVGLPDPNAGGGGDHALLMRKGAAASADAAAIAEVSGIAGVPMRQIFKLQWNRRSDTYCSSGAPPWVLGITGADGGDYTASLACPASLQQPGDHDLWTRDFWGDQTIFWGGRSVEYQVDAQAGSSALDGTLNRLAIVFDESPAETLFDNIVVTAGPIDARWHGPGPAAG